MKITKKGVWLTAALILAWLVIIFANNFGHIPKGSFGFTLAALMVASYKYGTLDKDGQL